VNREEQSKLVTDTAECLKNHAYTELVNTNGVEVWRCQEPGSIHLAFDICVTRFGIAVFGDIGSLAFGVGASYGIKFLAGNDPDYIYSKLEATSKQTDFNRPNFIGHVEEAICELVASKHASAPEWMRGNYPQIRGRGADLNSWLLDQIAQSEDPELSALAVALHEAWEFEDESDPSRAHEWLTDHEELLDIGDTWEWSLRKPTDSVWRRLYRVRHAARMIMEQKAQAQAVAQ
jgi:hypothetical protein